MAVLRLLAGLTYISVFSINLTTALGFALAVDYSLFILRRFREERERGLHPHDALRASLGTAGRTVLFSGVTVALSLSGALVFPLPYLRSYAFAGVGVVVASELAALIVLPAAITVLGGRLDARRPPKRGAHAGAERPRRPAGEVWATVADRVMRHPVIFGCLAVGFLLTLASPVTHLSVALADDRVLPATAESHQVNDAMRNDFAVCLPCQVPIVVPGVDAREPAAASRLGDYAERLSALRGVARVDTAFGRFAKGQKVSPAPADGDVYMGQYGGTWMSLWPTSPDPISTEAKDLAQRLHEMSAPFPVDIGGLAPHLVETKEDVLRSLPSALAVVVGAVFILLFLFTGSVVLPVKALVLNGLNLAAVLGILVLVFQSGHLLGVFNGIQTTGFIELTTPVLMFCVAFGLSMDYEIFLLARIREEYLRSRSNRQAVTHGLGATGPLLTCAGLAVIVVMVGVATSEISIVAMMGAGMALAVFLDITVIRAILVPAFMAIADDFNWWAPEPLRRLHERIGLREDSGVILAVPGGPSRVWDPVPPARPHHPTVRTMLTRPTLPLLPIGGEFVAAAARLPTDAPTPVRLPPALPPAGYSGPVFPPDGYPPGLDGHGQPMTDGSGYGGAEARAGTRAPVAAGWTDDDRQSAHWYPVQHPGEFDQDGEGVLGPNQYRDQSGYWWIIVQ
jgi:RND superfamily putative drug exporter